VNCPTCGSPYEREPFFGVWTCFLHPSLAELARVCGGLTNAPALSALRYGDEARQALARFSETNTEP
jgi:hypothetical protein